MKSLNLRNSLEGSVRQLRSLKAIKNAKTTRQSPDAESGTSPVRSNGTKSFTCSETATNARIHSDQVTSLFLVVTLREQLRVPDMLGEDASVRLQLLHESRVQPRVRSSSSNAPAEVDLEIHCSSANQQKTI